MGTATQLQATGAAGLNHMLVWFHFACGLVWFSLQKLNGGGGLE
jgi:hypothetical protein